MFRCLPGFLFSWLGVVLWILLFHLTPALATEKRGSAHEDVARLNVAGHRSRHHCTAFKVQGGAIVTAAHCLPYRTKAFMHVVWAYDRGDFVRHERFQGNDYTVIALRDLALTCPSSSAASATNLNDGFPVTDQLPKNPVPVMISGYGQPSVHVLQKIFCTLADAPATSDGTIRKLDCPMARGMSGSPVFDRKTGLVLGVVSSTTRDHAFMESLTSAIVENVCEQ